jgi:hypothetical protein
MRTMLRALWYTVALAGPAMAVTFVGTPPEARACAQPNGGMCSCGCSSNCTGYSGCGHVTTDDGCQRCVLDGSGCSEPACT